MRAPIAKNAERVFDLEPPFDENRQSTPMPEREPLYLATKDSTWRIGPPVGGIDHAPGSFGSRHGIPLLVKMGKLYFSQADCC